MENDLSYQVFLFLRELGYNIDKEYIRARLISHPDFPSAFSITSLLHELSISNTAVQLSINDLATLKGPALAFVDGKSFYHIKDILFPEKSIKNFTARWNGILILAEEKLILFKSDELKKNEKENKLKRTWKILLALILASLIYIALSKTDINSISLFILSCLGLYLSWQVVLIELGKVSIFSNHLCNESDSLSCKSVILNTKPGPFNIHISDLSIAFFSGIMILILMKENLPSGYTTNLIIQFLCYLSIIPLVISIYYQSFILRKWCALCISIILCICLMIFIATKLESSKELNLNEGMIKTALLMLFPGSIWLNIRSLISERSEALNKNLLLKRFKRNPELFQMLLLNQVKLSSLSCYADFQIGNSQASCQIIAVVSPLCGPCSEAYEMLKKVKLRYSDQIGITIRFSVGKGIESKMIIIRSMLRYAISTEGFMHSPDQIETMLDTWYQTTDIHKFIKQYPSLAEFDVDNYIAEIQNWIKNSKISYTPTIVINGYKLPDPYTCDDLLEFGDTYLEIFSQKIKDESIAD